MDTWHALDRIVTLLAVKRKDVPAPQRYRPNKAITPKKSYDRKDPETNARLLVLKAALTSRLRDYSITKKSFHCLDIYYNGGRVDVDMVEYGVATHSDAPIDIRVRNINNGKTNHSFTDYDIDGLVEAIKSLIK